jgi:hypothetical protein
MFQLKRDHSEGTAEKREKREKKALDEKSERCVNHLKGKKAPFQLAQTYKAFN